MKKNILYFGRTMGLGGTENVILQLCNLMKDDNKVVVCSSGGINEEKLKDMGIKHYTIPDIEKKSVKDIAYILKILLKIIKDEEINIIHTHHRMAAFYTTLISYFKKITFINTAHNTFKNKKILTKFSYRKAKIIAVGEKVKENLCDYYKLNKDNIVVIYNGIEPFNGKIEINDVINNFKKSGNFVVGNFGRLSEQKGMNYFIEAASLILEKHKNVKFIIVGDGPLKNELKNLIIQKNIEEHVILLGYRKDVQNIMSQIDFVVLSSLWEGLPLTPIEAFSVSKPVIATSVDGTVEIVEDKVNGILVEPKSPEALSKSIEFLLNNPEKIKEYGNNAKKSYESKFIIDIFNKNYINYYNGGKNLC